MRHALVTQSPRHMYSTEKHVLLVALALCAAFASIPVINAVGNLIAILLISSTTS